MHITVNEYSGKRIRLSLPSGLVLNRLSASILSARLKKTSISLSAKQLHILFRAIKSYKASHPQWMLIEAESQGGDVVEIMI